MEAYLQSWRHSDPQAPSPPIYFNKGCFLKSLALRTQDASAAFFNERGSVERQRARRVMRGVNTWSRIGYVRELRSGKQFALERVRRHLSVAHCGANYVVGRIRGSEGRCCIKGVVSRFRGRSPVLPGTTLNVLQVDEDVALQKVVFSAGCQ